MLDTSGYSAMQRHHPQIQQALEAASEIHVSPVVLGELLSGFRGGVRRVHNEKELYAFLDQPIVRVAQVNAETAERYAEIADGLRAAGTPIPTNDMWIAAGAMEHGLRVITTDAHFQRVPQVLVECYAAKAKLQNEANSG